MVEFLLKGGAHVNVVNHWMESPLHVALQVLIDKKDRISDDFERVKKILQILVKEIGQSSYDCHEFLSWKDTKGNIVINCVKTIENIIFKTVFDSLYSGVKVLHSL